MSKNVFEIQLSFFAGFYDSILYNSDTLYYEVNDEDNMEHYRYTFDDENLVPNDLDIDLDTYKKDVSKAFVEEFYNRCPDYVKSLKMSELTSPRFYNFETDKLYANITFDGGWKNEFLAFMAKNKETLTERIEKDWTSYGGFMSFMSNDYDKWVDEFCKDRPDVRYIGTMLGYIVEDIIKNEEMEDAYYCLNVGAIEDIYISNYIINTKEKNDGNE